MLRQLIASNSSLEEIKEKIHFGEVNLHDDDGLVPLMYAIQFKRIDVIEYLVQNGADLHTQDKAGWSPLIWAIRSG